MDNIKEDIDGLFDEIKETALYKNYTSVKKQLEENTEIMGTINEIKRLQKIATNNNDDIVENNIKSLYKKLDNYPLYQSYRIIKEELQNELLVISDNFSSYFLDILRLDD